jgi:hypothetical protein
VAFRAGEQRRLAELPEPDVKGPVLHREPRFRL